MDTRAGTLARMLSQDDFAQIIRSGYHTRLEDRWEQVDTAKFYEMYDARDKMTLRASHITLVPVMVSEFVIKTHTLQEVTPWQFKPVVYLNIYPYKLVEDEVKLFKQLLFNQVGWQFDIKVVNLRPDEITTAFLKENIAIAAMYGYAEWINTQSKNETLTLAYAGDVGMVSPMVGQSRTDESVGTEEKLKGTLNDIRELAQVFVNFQFLNVDTFSLAWKFAS